MFSIQCYVLPLFIPIDIAETGVIFLESIRLNEYISTIDVLRSEKNDMEIQAMQEQNLKHDYNKKLQSYCQELESGSKRPHDIELANFLREVRDLVLEQTNKVHAAQNKRKIVCGA